MSASSVRSRIHKGPSTGNILFAVFGSTGDGESVAQGGGDVVSLYNGCDLFHRGGVNGDGDGVLSLVIGVSVIGDELDLYVRMCTNGVGSLAHKLPGTSNILFAVFGGAGDGESVAQGGGDVVSLYSGCDLFHRGGGNGEVCGSSAGIVALASHSDGSSTNFDVVGIGNGVVGASCQRGTIKSDSDSGGEGRAGILHRIRRYGNSGSADIRGLGSGRILQVEEVYLIGKVHGVAFTVFQSCNLNRIKAVIRCDSTGTEDDAVVNVEPLVVYDKTLAAVRRAIVATAECPFTVIAITGQSNCNCRLARCGIFPWIQGNAPSSMRFEEQLPTREITRSRPANKIVINISSACVKYFFSYILTISAISITGVTKTNLTQSRI